MYFGVKTHTNANAKPGLVHTARGTSGNVRDVVQSSALLHCQESMAFGNTGCQGIDKCPDAKADVSWCAAMRPVKRRTLNEENAADAMIDRVQKLKVGIRAKVGHLFRVFKRQFGFVKVHYRDLKKNTTQLFTLSHLWITHSKLLGAQG